MFLHCKDPLPLSEACLHALLPSLNAPVADIDELPTGPVRAAIVIYAAEYGDLGLAVGIRALENGETALYKSRELIPDEGSIPEALELALSFAEGLGFLFDDDMIDIGAGSGRRAALEHWNRLMGDGEVFAPRAPAEPPPPASNPGLPSADQALLPPLEDLLDGDDALDLAEVAVEVQPGTGSGLPEAQPADELLLDDLMEEVEDEPELLLEPTDTLSGSALTVVAGAAEDSGPACRDASEAVGLSKFRVMAAEAEPGPAALKTPSAPAEPGAPDRVRVRAAPGQDDPEADAAGAAALGRIAIVRQKGEGARNLLARLLSSF